MPEATETATEEAPETTEAAPETPALEGAAETTEAPIIEETTPETPLDILSGEETATPEAYTPWDMPDGFTLNEALAAEATPIFQGAKISQEVSQEIVNLLPKYHEAQQAAATAAHTAQQNEWISAIKADPDYGGTKFDATVKAARSAVERVGGQPLKDALEASGFGSNPELVKAFARIETTFFSEDSLVTSSTQASSEKPVEQRMFGNTDAQLAAETGNL